MSAPGAGDAQSARERRAARDDDEYTGDWSDWIAPEPAPKHAAAGQRVDDAYEDYADEYEDDDYYDDPPPRRRLGSPQRRTPLTARGREPYSRQQWMVPLLGVLAVLAITAAVAVQFAKATGPEPSRAMPTLEPAPTTITSMQPAAAGAPDLCPNEAVGTHVRGNGPGSTHSGPDVILALQNRYYTERNGQRVREMFVPDSPTTPTAEAIQAGIDSIPAGTTYCVQIMPGPFASQHVMVVTETHPDKSRKVWPAQLVLTTAIGDRTLVSAVLPYTEGDTTPR
ncbi:hypothetical protein [Nocardia sp. NPDC005978]|uniref:hypothetical protein n=1 Tax=unclassified Nocardia TaxID=2637762 RepID=UPI0033A6C8DE